jgi:signal transduction histidine kinase
LHPPLLDDLGLVSALKEYTLGFSERSGIDTQFYLLSDFGRLPQPIETALFRVVQESLTNIQRHSGSPSAKIRLRRESSTVVLEVIDFGHGMRTPSNGNPPSGEIRLGVGVPGMHERMAQLGGRLEIDSSSAGTTVRATILLPDVVSTETLDDSTSHPHRG